MTVSGDKAMTLYGRLKGDILPTAVFEMSRRFGVASETGSAWGHYPYRQIIYHSAKKYSPLSREGEAGEM